MARPLGILVSDADGLGVLRKLGPRRGANTHNSPGGGGAERGPAGVAGVLQAWLLFPSNEGSSRPSQMGVR